jgi:hypothetical protein
MLLKVDKEAIKFNVSKAESISKRIGSTCSVMVKDFYSSLKIQDNIDNRIWSSSNVKESYNYILFQNNVNTHKGGLIVSEEEVNKISLEAKKHKRKFQGFIPVNMFDRSEERRVGKEC